MDAPALRAAGKPTTRKEPQIERGHSDKVRGLRNRLEGPKTQDSEKHKIESAKLFFAKLQQAHQNNGELEQTDTLAGVAQMPISYQVVDSFDSLMQIVGKK